MIAVQHNLLDFNVDYFTPSFKDNNSLLSVLKSYVLGIKKLYTSHKMIKYLIYNVESFLLLSGANTVEKIDSIIINLEELTELTQELLENDENFNKWYNYPLRYGIEKVETSVMSFQAILGSQQALLMHQQK